MDETSQPASKRPATKADVVSAVVVVCIGLVIAIYVSSPNSPDSSVHAPQARPIDQATAPQPAPEPARPPIPMHNYVIEENGLYGYQPVVSDADRTNGVAQKPLVMVKYLGQRNGTYRAEVQIQPGMTTILSCKDPCEYFKVTPYAYGESGDPQTMKAEGTLGGGILEDAIAGELKPFKAGKREQ